MRSNPPETIRKLYPGSVSGDRVVQPGVHTVPTAGGVRIAASESPDLPCECLEGAVTISDSFTQADGDLGVLWLPIFSPHITVVSNVANNTVSGVNMEHRLLDSPETQLAEDMTVNIDFVSLSTDGFVAVVARAPLTASDWYIFGIQGASVSYIFGSAAGDWVLGKRVSGVFSTLDSNSDADPSPGDTLTLEVVGTSIVGKLNGTTKLSATDSAIPGDTLGCEDFEGNTCGFALGSLSEADNFTMDGTACVH